MPHYKHSSAQIWAVVCAVTDMFTLRSSAGKFSTRLNNHFRAVVIGKSVVGFQIDPSTVENKLLALKQSTTWLTESYPESFTSGDKITFTCSTTLSGKKAGSHQTANHPRPSCSPHMYTWVSLVWLLLIWHKPWFSSFKLIWSCCHSNQCLFPNWQKSRLLE